MLRVAVLLTGVLAGPLDAAAPAPPVPAPAAPAIGTSAAPASPAPDAPAAPRVVDLMPDFWRFWAAAEGRDLAEQVRLLRDEFIAPHRAFYDKVAGAAADERLAQYLRILTPEMPALRRVADEFPSQLRSGFASFLAAYPDFDPDVPIYIGPTLFSSSGQVRYLDGRPVIVFGLDVFAVMMADTPDRVPDVHHELFHAYHWQRNAWIAEAGREFHGPGGRVPLYFNLWSEGLALFAARRMDVGAPLAEVLSSRSLAETGPEVVARVAGELRERRNDTDAAAARDYFYLSTKRADIPPRIAYLVGLRMAEEVGRRLTIDQMVALHGHRLRRAVSRGLKALERRAPPP